MAALQQRLIGHCSVAFAGGWVVHAFPIFRRDDGSLAGGVPSMPQLDRDGRVRVREDGKRVYTALLTFEDGEARHRWDRTVLSALGDAGITGATS